MHSFACIAETEQPFDEIVQWLSQIELKCMIEKFKQENITTLSDVKKLDADKINSLFEEQKELKN